MRSRFVSPPRRRARASTCSSAGDDQLRPALEPDPAGAAPRPYPPHRPGTRRSRLQLRRQRVRGRPADFEGRILERLLEKLDQMRVVLADRVFDVIGEVLSLNE